LPDSPRTNPGVPKGLLRLCGTIAPGFSEVFASAKALSQARGDAHDCAFGTYYDTWFSNAESFHQLVKANPIVTLALTALGRAAGRRPSGKMIRRRKLPGISPDSPAPALSLSKGRVHLRMKRNSCFTKETGAHVSTGSTTNGSILPKWQT